MLYGCTIRVKDRGDGEGDREGGKDGNRLGLGWGGG